MNLLSNFGPKKVFAGAVIHIDLKKCCLGLLGFIVFGCVIGEMYLYMAVQKSDGILPVVTKVNGSTQIPCHPQPYCYIDMKTLFLDLPEFYVYAPMAAFICSWASCGSPTCFLSANAITICHAFLAMISAILIMSDSLRTRRLGLVIFIVRNLLDALDGAVARAKWHLTPHATETMRGSIGYYLDGISDGFGMTFFIVACFLYTSRHLPRGKTRWSAALPAFFFGMQVLGSSICWNRYISAYMNILETNTVGIEGGEDFIRQYQSRIVKSKMMWLVIMLWRLLNPHALIHILLAAAYLDKTLEFMVWVQYVGFLPLAAAAFLSEVHVNDIQIYLLGKGNFM